MYGIHLPTFTLVLIGIGGARLLPCGHGLNFEGIMPLIRSDLQAHYEFLHALR